jgi:hypothetical protein
MTHTDLLRQPWPTQALTQQAAAPAAPLTVTATVLHCIPNPTAPKQHHNLTPFLTVPTPFLKYIHHYLCVPASQQLHTPHSKAPSNFMQPVRQSRHPCELPKHHATMDHQCMPAHSPPCCPRLVLAHNHLCICLLPSHAGQRTSETSSCPNMMAQLCEHVMIQLLAHCRCGQCLTACVTLQPRVLSLVPCTAGHPVLQPGGAALRCPPACACCARCR